MIGIKALMTDFLSPLEGREHPEQHEQHFFSCFMRPLITEIDQPRAFFAQIIRMDKISFPHQHARWEEVKGILSKKITNGTELSAAISSIRGREIGRFWFDHFTDEEDEHTTVNEPINREPFSKFSVFVWGSVTSSSRSCFACGKAVFRITSCFGSNF